jgi:Fic family protein
LADWDADSPQLRRNLTELLARIRDAARGRELPTVEAARRWHVEMMHDLDVPDANFIGGYRGEVGLETIDVTIGRHRGVAPGEVAAALVSFEHKLQQVVGRLDALIPLGEQPDADQTAAVIDACAWAHAEWVRIHPFANGNGRTARLWANSLAMRYGLPPFVRLRPRPNHGYGDAGESAMQGDWKVTAAVFRRMFNDFF